MAAIAGRLAICNKEMGASSAITSLRYLQDQSKTGKTCFCAAIIF